LILPAEHSFFEIIYYAKVLYYSRDIQTFESAVTCYDTLFKISARSNGKRSSNYHESMCSLINLCWQAQRCNVIFNKIDEFYEISQALKVYENMRAYYEILGIMMMSCERLEEYEKQGEILRWYRKDLDRISDKLTTQQRIETWTGYLVLLSSHKSKNYKEAFPCDKKDLEDIDKFSNMALKLSSNREETKNIGYQFKYQKACYYACTTDLQRLEQAKKLIATIKSEMGGSFRMLFQSFPPETLMERNLVEFKKIQRRNRILFPVINVAVVASIAGIAYWIVKRRE